MAARDLIPYGRQTLDETDIRAVIKALRGDWLTQGPAVERFERALAQYCGAKYAVAVSSGTAALHLACLAAGLKNGDEAIVPAMTFLATANAVFYAGAKPVLVDIDPATVNIDPESARKRLTARTKAILPVHFAGLPADIPALARIAKENKLVLIEDGCHALGAAYKSAGDWHRVGSCRHSDMTVFSFHPVKTVTTGEGGAITTNNRDLYDRLKTLRSHGIVKTAEMRTRQGPWYYEMRFLGLNYRLTDIQCALGLSQLKKINKFIRRRGEIARQYDAAFRGMSNIKSPIRKKDIRHAHHLYILRFDFKRMKQSRQSVMECLRKKGVQTQVHYIPLYRQPYYKKHVIHDNRIFSNTEMYYNQALSIPLFPSMSDKDVTKVVRAIQSCVR